MEAAGLRCPELGAKPQISSNLKYESKITSFTNLLLACMCFDENKWKLQNMAPRDLGTNDRLFSKGQEETEAF